jgi:hypothetical protein
MDCIMKYLPLPEFLITRIKESETHDNTPDKASSAVLNADVNADVKTSQELITFRLTHARFSVVLCVLPSRGQQSVRRIFHQELQPHMLSKLDIQKSICDLRRQLTFRGIKLKTLTHAIIRDLISRDDDPKLTHENLHYLIDRLSSEGFRMTAKYPDGRVAIFLPKDKGYCVTKTTTSE